MNISDLLKQLLIQSLSEEEIAELIIELEKHFKSMDFTLAFITPIVESLKQDMSVAELKEELKLE